MSGHSFQSCVCVNRPPIPSQNSRWFETKGFWIISFIELPGKKYREVEKNRRKQMGRYIYSKYVFGTGEQNYFPKLVVAEVDLNCRSCMRQLLSNATTYVEASWTSPSALFFGNAKENVIHSFDTNQSRIALGCGSNCHKTTKLRILFCEASKRVSF